MPKVGGNEDEEEDSFLEMANLNLADKEAAAEAKSPLMPPLFALKHANSIDYQ